MSRSLQTAKRKAVAASAPTVVVLAVAVFCCACNFFTCDLSVATSRSNCFSIGVGPDADHAAVAYTATLQGKDVCAGGGVTRSQVLPPTVAGFQALLAGFHTNSFRVLGAYVLAHEK